MKMRECKSLSGSVQIADRDRDKLMMVESGQKQFTLGEFFGKVLGKDELGKLKNVLEGKSAALVLVYVGEDNNVHSAWSSELEFGLQQHPVREGGIVGLYVIRIDGVDGFYSGGVKAGLKLAAGGGYELVTSVEGKELRVPIKEAYIDIMGARKYLKMKLEDGNVLGFHMFVDDNGKLHAELAIYRKRGTYRSLRLIRLIPEIEKYYYYHEEQYKEVVLRNILVGEYIEEGEMKHVFMSIYGDLPKEALDQLNVNPEHTMLEIWAIDLFRGKGEDVINMEKPLEDVGRRIDIVTKGKDGVEILTECKHGTESRGEIDLDQIEGFFAHAKSHGNKVRLFIGKDLTGEGAKAYVKHAIELSEDTKSLYYGVPLEIYIKGELKSLSEIKQMVGG